MDDVNTWPRPSFVEYMKDVEGKVLSPQSKRHMVYCDLNGKTSGECTMEIDGKVKEGYWTVGYGHNLGKGSRAKNKFIKINGEMVDVSKGITSEQADWLLKKDIIAKTKITAKNIEDKYPGKWDSWPTAKREAMIDYTFNLGKNVTTAFKNLTQGMVDDDPIKIAGEFQRYTNVVRDSDGNITSKKPLGRNKKWWKQFGESLTGIPYEDTDAIQSEVQWMKSQGMDTGLWAVAQPRPGGLWDVETDDEFKLAMRK